MGASPGRPSFHTNSRSVFFFKLRRALSRHSRRPTARGVMARASVLLPCPLNCSFPPRTGPIPRGTILRDQGFAPDLVAVAPGNFHMGGIFDDPEGYPNELPSRDVVVADGFLIGRYPVTFREFDIFARMNGLALPYDEGWGREGRPVIHVSWTQAQAYAKWLRDTTRLPYRLCTEAEWEFARSLRIEREVLMGTRLEPRTAEPRRAGIWDHTGRYLCFKRLGCLRYPRKCMGMGRR